MLWEMCMSEVFIGYPKDIAHRHNNEHNVNVWGYRKLIQRLREVLGESGIKLHEVNEAFTSKICSICKRIH
jgi:putative transposase